MIKPITTPGKTYAVTSPNGCTVTTEDGLTLAEVEAGKQGYFVAVGGKVLLSDDSAILTQLFKLAPQQRLALLGVLGGGDPAWLKALEAKLTALLDGSQFVMEWLADEGKLVVHTDRVSDELLAAVKASSEAFMPEGAVLLQYNHNMDISWREINKYAGFETMPALYAAYPNFQDDLTSDGGWIYPLTNLQYVGTTQIGVGDKHWRAFRNLKANYAYFYVPNLARIDSQFLAGDKNAPQEVEIYAPKLTTSGRIVADAGNWVKKIKAYLPVLSQGNHAFYNNRKLTSIDVEMPSLSNGYNFLNEAQIDKESALRVLNSIPSYTSGSHPLTIGIHIDHQSDEEVLEAIANAESRGWTLTVQWNGTPTAQASVTYGLRKPSIYAKVGELEDGEQFLDWGHYVTDPSGYEEFRSVEEAEEYFSIKSTE